MIEQLEFYRRRERQERAAAKQAANLAAKRVHQELAILYASLQRGIDPAEAVGGT
jgi:hypothetical protein